MSRGRSFFLFPLFFPLSLLALNALSTTWISYLFLWPTLLLALIISHSFQKTLMTIIHLWQLFLFFLLFQLLFRSFQGHIYSVDLWQHRSALLPFVLHSGLFFHSIIRIFVRMLTALTTFSFLLNAMSLSKVQRIMSWMKSPYTWTVAILMTMRQMRMAREELQALKLLIALRRKERSPMRLITMRSVPLLTATLVRSRQLSLQIQLAGFPSRSLTVPKPTKALTFDVIFSVLSILLTGAVLTVENYEL